MIEFLITNSAETYAILYWQLIKVLCCLVEQQLDLRIVDFLAVYSVII